MKTWSASRFGKILRSSRGVYFTDQTRPFSPSRFYIVWKLRKHGFVHIYRDGAGYWFKPGLPYHRGERRSAQQREEGLRAGREAYRHARRANPFNLHDEWTKHLAWDEGWKQEIKKLEDLQ